VHEIDFDQIRASLHALSSTGTTGKIMTSGMTDTIAFSGKYDLTEFIGIIVTA